MACIECGTELKMKHYKLCKKCRQTITVKCACGCGEDILKYNTHHRGSKSFRFKRGHANKIYFTKEAKRVAKLRSKNETGHKNKVILVKHYGGKCLDCELEYDGTNAAVFQFHHINPDQKTWKQRGLNCTNHSIERLKLMTNKCRLVCANCHKLRHSARY